MECTYTNRNIPSGVRDVVILVIMECTYTYL